MIHALDCDFAVSFFNDDPGFVWRQNLVVGTNDLHFVNREQSCLMHLAYDGTLLNSIKFTHSTESVDLIGIAPFSNGANVMAFGFLGDNDCYLISMARSDLSVDFNRVLENKRIVVVSSDSAGRMYLGGHTTNDFKGFLIRLNENSSPMEFDLQVMFSRPTSG